MLYSLLEQHKDGSWWYHKNFTFDTPEEVEKCFNEYFKFDIDRPHMCFEHEKPMWQGYSSCTFDFKRFVSPGGRVVWEKE